MESILHKQGLISLPLWAIIVLLPFGQLFGFRFEIAGFSVNLLVLDLVVLAAFLLSLLVVKCKKDTHKLGMLAVLFLAYIMFSFIAGSLTIGKFSIISLLYAKRISVYLISTIFFVYLFGLGKQKKWLDFLLISLIATSIFGLVQYMYLPDLRALKAFGWDDHLGRLVGTYLDPGFMAAVMAVGCMISLYKAFKARRAEYYIAFALFSLTLLLTYSRAGYLAFLMGTIYLGVIHKKFINIMIILLIFLVSIFILPRGEGIGVKLERTNSIEQRMQSYTVTEEIFKKSPVFGIGYNNLCLAKNTSGMSHSCYGADNSILLVLSTMGVVGLILILDLIKRAYSKLSKEKSLVVAVAICIFTTSMFINSVTYPFLLILLILVYSLNLSRAKE